MLQVGKLCISFLPLFLLESFSRTLIEQVISPWQPRKEWFIAGEKTPLHPLLYQNENLSFLFWFHAGLDQKGSSWGLLLPHHLNRPESRQWSRCNFKAFVWKLYSFAKAGKRSCFLILWAEVDDWRGVVLLLVHKPPLVAWSWSSPPSASPCLSTWSPPSTF